MSNQEKDYEYSQFLRYLEYDSQYTKKVHSFYLPYFANCKRVLDLGCGKGDFLELLKKQGIKAIGVERDKEFCKEITEKGLEVICSDVFDYLSHADDESFDGIFMSHLVEHLSYEDILRLFELCYRALKKSGKILVVVPNVRSIGMHLDWFYRDLTHEGFRHPSALSFLLESSNFSLLETGDNQNMLNPFLNDIKQCLDGTQTSIDQVAEKLEAQKDRLLQADGLFSAFTQLQPNVKAGAIKKMWRSFRDFFARYFLFPYVAPLTSEIKHSNESLITSTTALTSTNRELLKLIEKLDKSFEVYLYAEKKLSLMQM